MRPGGELFRNSGKAPAPESQVGSGFLPALDKDTVSPAPRGVAGWHVPAGCPQPWAAATGSVPAPRGHLRTSGGCAPCSSLQAVHSSAPVGLLLCARGACRPAQEDSPSAGGPLYDTRKGSARQASRGPRHCLTHSAHFPDGDPGAQRQDGTAQGGRPPPGRLGTRASGCG